MSLNLRKIFTIVVVWVVEFSSGGYEIGNIFCLKINMPKGNC